MTTCASQVSTQTENSENPSARDNGPKAPTHIRWAARRSSCLPVELLLPTCSTADICDLRGENLQSYIVGTSPTLLLVEAANSVLWTKPYDFQSEAGQVVWFDDHENTYLLIPVQ